MLARDEDVRQIEKQTCLKEALRVPSVVKKEMPIVALEVGCTQSHDRNKRTAPVSTPPTPQRHRPLLTRSRLCGVDTPNLSWGHLLRAHLTLPQAYQKTYGGIISAHYRQKKIMGDG